MEKKRLDLRKKSITEMFSNMNIIGDMLKDISKDYEVPPRVKFKSRYKHMKKHIIISCVTSFIWGGYCVFIGFMVRTFLLYYSPMIYIIIFVSILVFLLGSVPFIQMFYMLKHCCIEVEAEKDELKITYELTGEEYRLNWKDVTKISVMSDIKPVLYSPPYIVLRIHTKNRKADLFIITEDDESFEIAQYVTKMALDRGIRMEGRICFP